MALSTSENIFIQEGNALDGATGFFRAPGLQVEISIDQSDNVRATVITLNSSDLPTSAAGFSLSLAELEVNDADAATIIAEFRAMVERTVKDRLNALNGSEVVFYS